MIERWIDHEAFRRDEQFMAVLFDLGMATIEQLIVVTGWSRRTVRRQLERLYRRNRRNRIEQDPWLLSHRLAKSHGRSRFVYTLGRSGMEYVQKMRQDDEKVRESPFGQAYHFLGTNEIYVRMLRHRFCDRAGCYHEKCGAPGIDRSEIAWLSSREATERLVMALERVMSIDKIDTRKMIRPDARLSYRGNHYLIEFDNDTEGARKIEQKFHGYFDTLSPLRQKDRPPVLWVTTSDRRRDVLEKVWTGIKRHSYSTSPDALPVMHFFTAGEETLWLLGRASDGVTGGAVDGAQIGHKTARQPAPRLGPPN